MRQRLRLLVLIPLVAGHVQAQRPIPRDSSRPDSARTDSVPRLQCFECAGYLGLASVAAFFFAPAAILLVPPLPGAPSTSSGSAADFFEYSVEGRAIGDTAQTGGHSETVQWSTHGTYVELRLATWYIPQTFQYQTVRFGRFVQRRRRLTGGVTLGYQRTPRDRSQQGPEIAFPLIIGGERARLRSEASYVLSPKRVNISYRCQAEARIRRGPLQAGIDFELKSIREPTPFTGGISIVLSIRR